MTDTPLIERVARAIADKERYAYFPGDEHYEGLAQAAAEVLLRGMALENLPKAVTQAGGTVLYEAGVASHLAGDVWEAMRKAVAASHNINIKEGGE